MSVMKVVFSDPREIADFLNKVERHNCSIQMSYGQTKLKGRSFLGVVSMGLGSEIELIIFNDNCDSLKRDIAPYLVA